MFDFSWLTSELVSSLGNPSLGWVQAIPYVIMAASAIYGAISGARANRNNQNAVEWSSMMTSKNILETGLANARATLAATRAENAMTLIASKMRADDQWDLAEYNADLRMLVGDYNAQLTESEIGSVWEAAGLDIQQIENQGKALKGEMLAAYGASGAQINDTDSVADALISAETATEMDKYVVRHGADMRADQIMNEGARSRWDGYMAASQILYEGGKSSLNTLASGAISILGNGIQGQINANNIYDNAVRGAATAFAGGQIEAGLYASKARQNMADGLFSAAASLISGYVASQAPTSNTTMATASQPSTPQIWSGNTSYGNFTASLLSNNQRSTLLGGGGGSTYQSQLEPLFKN